MTIQEFRDYMASGKPVVGGGDVHMMFHQQLPAPTNTDTCFIVLSVNLTSSNILTLGRIHASMILLSFNRMFQSSTSQTEGRRS